MAGSRAAPDLLGGVPPDGIELLPSNLSHRSRTLVTTASPEIINSPAPLPVAQISAELERSLTQVARAILRLEVPRGALPEGVTINPSGYRLLVRVSEFAPARLSDVAESAGLDLSTVSRQVRDLVAMGLITKMPDPADGRAALLSLTERGAAVIDAVSGSRRRALSEAISGWTDEERNALATGLLRLGTDLEDRENSAGSDR